MARAGQDVAGRRLERQVDRGFAVIEREEPAVLAFAPLNQLKRPVVGRDPARGETPAARVTTSSSHALRYAKDVIVVETAYAFTLGDDDGWGNIIGSPDQLVPGYPATPERQAAMFRDVMSIVRAVPDGRGLGVFYWDPTWTGVIGNGWTPRDPSQGNAWENQALFDFDDRPLPAMDEFKP